MFASGKELQLIALVLGAIIVLGVSYLIKWLRGPNPGSNIPPETKPEDVPGPIAAMARKEALGCFLMIVGVGALIVIGLIWGAIQRLLG